MPEAEGGGNVQTSTRPYFWVTSGETFGAVLAEHGAALYADIERFSPVQPVRAWAEVV